MADSKKSPRPAALRAFGFPFLTALPDHSPESEIDVESWMKSAANVFLAELAIAAIGAGFIGVFYIYVIPHYSTHSVLIFGLAVVAFLSGYVARKLLVHTRKVGWIIIMISVAVTLLTLCLALCWILNVRGA